MKLEYRQTYRESEANSSQEAYERGDLHEAIRLLRNEAEGDRQIYQDIKDRDIDYARIRLVQEPLTDYLKYELLAYEIRTEMGENIEVVRCDQSTDLPSEESFDFLLFDRHTALIHDYGDVGRQTGGWITHAPDVITALEARATDLRQLAVPLEQVLRADRR